MVMYFAFLGNLMVVGGMIISALVAFSDYQVNGFRMSLVVSNSPYSQRLLESYQSEHGNFFAGLTSRRKQSFWMGIIAAGLGKVITVVASGLELFL